MITEATLTVAELKARAVDVEMERPVQTAAGRIATALMVLIDLRTGEGTTGRSYVRSYATFALEPLRRLVENLGAARSWATPWRPWRSSASCRGCSVCWGRRGSPE